jgi:hypothetical protein
MKKAYYFLWLAVFFLSACKKPSGEKTSFQSYLNNFPEIKLPLTIVSTDNPTVKDLKLIDSSFVQQFLPMEKFGNLDYSPTSPVYYFGAPKLSTEFNSVIVYQCYPDSPFSHYYFLVNYDKEGNIISTKTLADRNDASTWHKLDGKLEAGNLSMTEQRENVISPEERYLVKNKFSFIISPNGSFEPVIKKEFITDWDRLTDQGDDYVIEEREYALGKGNEQLHFKKEGKKYFLIYDMLNRKKEYELVAFKESATGEYELVLTNSDWVYKDDTDLEHKEVDMSVRRSEKDTVVFIWTGDEHLEFPFSNFVPRVFARNFEIISAKEESFEIISENGVGKILLGSTIESLNNFYAKEKIRNEVVQSEGDDYTIYLICDDKGKQTLEVTPDETGKIVSRISAYGEMFRTEMNIGPGDTFEDLKKAYKITGIVGGEIGLMVFVEGLKVTFILDGEKLQWSPDTEYTGEVPGNVKITSTYIYK